MPCEFATPPGPGRKLMVGEMMLCETSWNAANRESAARSPSSWLPAGNTTPRRVRRGAEIVVGEIRQRLEVEVFGRRLAGRAPHVRRLERRRQREAVVDRVHPAL